MEKDINTTPMGDEAKQPEITDESDMRTTELMHLNGRSDDYINSYFEKMDRLQKGYKKRLPVEIESKILNGTKEDK